MVFFGDFVFCAPHAIHVKHFLYVRIYLLNWSEGVSVAMP